MAQKSNRIRFGPTTAEKLKPPPGEARADYWDITMPRFGVRVGRRRRIWMVRYRLNGEKRRDKIGFIGPPPRGLSLADARKKADALLAKVDYGLDPRLEAPKDLKALTFDQLVDEYRKRHGETKRSWKSDEIRIKRDLSPAFGQKLAAAVTDADIENVIDTMKARGVTVGATRTFETARAIFRWAVKKKLVPRAPTDTMEAPFKTGKRNRFLSEDEIKRYWQALSAVRDEGPTKTRQETHARILKLMLLLGARGGELRRAIWADIDLERGLWHPPAERTKAERDFDLPLPGHAIKLFKEHRGQSEVYVFPRVDGQPELSATSANGVNRDVCATAGIVDFVPHDLRHTTATHLEGMGFPQSLIAKILGHRPEHRMTARYSAYRSEREMRIALEAWERRVLEMVGKLTAENVSGQSLENRGGHDRPVVESFERGKGNGQNGAA